MVKKTAVVIHGWPRPATLVENLGSFLEDRGYKVVIPDYLRKQKGFSLEGSLKIIKRELRGSQPDLIIGLSLGGIIAPHIAKYFPRARLVLVATGARFDPEVKWFRPGVKILISKSGKRIMEVIKNMSWGWFFLGSSLTNLAKGDKLKTPEIKKDSREIFDAFKLMDIDQVEKLIKWVLNLDNSWILSQISNVSLILSGSKDKLMPSKLGREIAGRIAGSSFKLVEGAHRSVLSDRGYAFLGDFLSS